MERKFPRDINALEGVFEFTAGYYSDMKLEDGMTYALNLAVEELFTNMVKYNKGTDEEILIRMFTESGSVHLQLVDYDVDPFDPESRGEANIGAPIEDRIPGGLGLHLVKSVVDKVSYEYKDRQMTVTVVKRLEQ